MTFGPSIAKAQVEEALGMEPKLDQDASHPAVKVSEEPKLHSRTWAAVVACGLLLFADNYGIAATGFWLGAVTEGLGSPEISIWFADAPLVVQVAFMPFFGLLADFGPPTRRWMTIGFALIAAVGLFIAGSAKNMQIGILGAALFGPSIISYFTCFAIVSEVLPHRMRGVGQSVLYCLTALGGVLGDIAGGVAIRDNAGGAGGWRWNLYVAGIGHVAAAGAIFLLYRPLPVHSLSKREYLDRLARLDYVGCALFMSAWVPLLYALITGGSAKPWNSGPVVATLTVGLAMFVMFLVHQIWFKKDGVLNHRLFRHRNFGLAMFGILIEGWFLITFNAFFGQMVSTLYEKRPVHAGLHGGVLWGVSLVSSTFCGWYSKRFRRVKEAIIFGFLCIVGAMIGLSRLTADPQDDHIAYGMVALAGIGLGIQLTLLVAVAQLAVDPDLIGICSALFTGVRSCGASIGVAIASAVFTAKLKTNLPEQVAKSALAAGVNPAQLSEIIPLVFAQDTQGLAGLGLDEQQLEAVASGALNGFAASFPYVFYVIMSGVCAVVIAMFFLGSVKDMMGWNIDFPLEKVQEMDPSSVQPASADDDIEKDSAGEVARRV